MTWKKFFPEGWIEEESATPPENVPQEMAVEKSQSKRGATIDLSSPANEKVEVRRSMVATPMQVILPAGKIDPQYMKCVLEEFEKDNLEGIDYFEFSGAVREMIEGGMSVDQAFRSAFIALKAGGLTFAKLVDTNTYYQDKLNTLQRDFESEADSIVLSKEKEVKKLAGQISTNQIKLQEEKTNLLKRIKEIDETTQSNDVQLNQLNTELEQVTNEQASRKSKMATASSNCLAAICGDLENINLYLQKK